MSVVRCGRCASPDIHWCQEEPDCPERPVKVTAGRRDQLALALAALDGLMWSGEGWERATAGALRDRYLSRADALLPTVDRMIRQAQAEALESAANDLGDDTPIYDSEDAGDWLRDRAAALRLTTDHCDVTQDAP